MIKKKAILSKIVCRSSAIMVYSDLEECFTKDVEISKKAMSLNGYCLRTAPKEIRDDEELVKLAVSVDPGALLYASDRIKNDLELLRSVFSNYLTDSARLRLIGGHKVEYQLKKKIIETGHDVLAILDSLIAKECAQKEKKILSEELTGLPFFVRKDIKKTNEVHLKKGKRSL